MSCDIQKYSDFFITFFFNFTLIDFLIVGGNNEHDSNQMQHLKNQKKTNHKYYANVINFRNDIFAVLLLTGKTFIIPSRKCLHSNQERSMFKIDIVHNFKHSILCDRIT